MWGVGGEWGPHFESQNLESGALYKFSLSCAPAASKKERTPNQISNLYIF